MQPPFADAPIYQLKVTLRDSDLAMWRRMLVPSDLTLAALHGVLQCVMGWTDSHQHEFRLRGVVFGTNEPRLEL